jgi:hypothetical protein
LPDLDVQEVDECFLARQAFVMLCEEEFFEEQLWSLVTHSQCLDTWVNERFDVRDLRLFVKKKMRTTLDLVQCKRI